MSNVNADWLRQYSKSLTQDGAYYGLAKRFVEIADEIERLERELSGERAKQVSGWYVEERPTFRQGAPQHELEELVTAEDCTAFVRLIEELRKRAP
jgi:hypothetical protein